MWQTACWGALGTFLVLISPAEVWDDAKLPPVDFTFVVDASGSMNEDNKMDAAKKALTHCLGSLRAEDAFNIIRFSTEVETFSDEFLKANEANLKRARNYIKKLRTRGGTNIDGALKEALGRKRIGCRAESSPTRHPTLDTLLPTLSCVRSPTQIPQNLWSQDLILHAVKASVV